jgi:hypothetical protein
VDVVATPVVVDGTSVVLELAVAEDMGVDVVATPAVLDGTGNSAISTFSSKT